MALAKYVRFVISALLLLLLTASAGLAETDLSVAWIARLPKIDYKWNSQNPAVEGWPAPGQRVTWVAHVRNLSDTQLSDVDYRWILDGTVVSSGKATLKPNKKKKFKLPWTWERARHELVFEIDPFHSIPEVEERNNRLLVYTDALAVGFWVERTFWNSIREVVTRSNIGATTFDDWMQRRVRQFNEMAALAKYPETPEGVLDRWRIDAIHVVGNGKLPVKPVGNEVRDWGADPMSYGTLYPNSKDRTIDMEWGFPAYTAPWYADSDAWTLMYNSLVHELGHARYLVDVYAWNVSADNDVIGINPPPPSNQFGWYHSSPEDGLMNTSWGFIDRYSAIALNRIAGHRAVQGNYNEPSNIGSFLNDLPEVNRIRIVTPDGKIFPHRQVRIYQASADRDPDWQSHVYQLRIDGKPDLEFETDGQGAIQVGRNPFSAGDLVISVDRFNALAIVELMDGSKSHWGYLEAREFNLAYWRGDTNFAEYDLVVDEPICLGPGLGPDDVTPYHESLVSSSDVTFEWNFSATQAGFKLWYSVDGGKPKRVNVKTTLPNGRFSKTISIKGKRVAWWLVYKTSTSPAECPTVRSTTYFFDIQNSP